MTPELDDTSLWLRGERTALGPFNGDLVDSYWRWEQDLAVMVGYGRQAPESLEQRRDGYQIQARNADNLRFTIYRIDRDEPVPVGTSAVLVDHAVRTGEMIVNIGEHGERAHGSGTEATWLTLDYAFHVTNLACVHVSTPGRIRA